MSGAKIGRLNKGDGLKVSMLSNDRLFNEIKNGGRGRDKPKCIIELIERGMSKEEIDKRVDLI